MDSLKITIVGSDAATSDGEVGYELLDESFVIVEEASHQVRDGLAEASLLRRVFLKGEEDSVEAAAQLKLRAHDNKTDLRMLNLVTELVKLLGVISEFLLLFFGVGEVLPISGILENEIRDGPSRLSEEMYKPGSFCLEVGHCLAS